MTVGGQDDRVVGCATIASQTAETVGVATVGSKGLPLMLLHGTGDKTLSHSCSERLYETYQRHARENLGFLKLFEGDDHALTKYSLQVEFMLCSFVMKCVGEEVAQDEDAEVLRRLLVSDEERIMLMETAGESPTRWRERAVSGRCNAVVFPMYELYEQFKYKYCGLGHNDSYEQHAPC